MFNKIQDLSTWIRDLLHLDSEKKIEWEKVPRDLKTQVIFWGLAGIGFMLLNIFIMISARSTTLLFAMVMGIVISLGMLAYCYYLRLIFTHQNYELVSGVCTEIIKTRILMRKSIIILIKNAKGITYRVALTSKNHTYISQGDMVNVYLPDELSYYEKDGIYVITRFYSIKKQAISD